MKLTKFVEAYSTEELTEKVQAAERDGWTYVELQTTVSLRPDTGTIPRSFKFADTHVLIMFAAMQRETAN